MHANGDNKNIYKISIQEKNYLPGVFHWSENKESGQIH